MIDKSFDLKDYMRGVTPTLAECETWEELDPFTLALIDLVIPEYLILC